MAHEATYTIVRNQMALIRLQGLTLSALVYQGVLEPKAAGSLVRDAAQHVTGGDPEVLSQLQGAWAKMATEVEHSKPRSR